MAVTHVGFTSSQGELGSGTSFAFSGNWAVVGGADHVLVVALGFAANPGSFSSQTFSGTPMTQAGATFVGTGCALAVFYLINPAAGNNNFNFVFANTVANCSLLSMEFSGVNLSTQVGTLATNSGASTSPSVVTPHGASDAVFGFLNSAGGGISARTPQTVGFNLTGTLCYENDYLDAPTPGGTSDTLNWTLGSSVNWVAAGLPILAPASAAPILMGAICL